MIVPCDRRYCGGTLIFDLDELVCLLCGERVPVPDDYEKFVQAETARVAQGVREHPEEPRRKGRPRGSHTRPLAERRALPYRELERQLRQGRILGAASPPELASEHIPPVGRATWRA